MTDLRNRMLSIDIMRGLTLFLMLFVNDLYVPGVPKWLVHTAATEDSMGLADWVFPGFLFIVGLSIPFAFRARVIKDQSMSNLLFHVIIRTVSLLTIGVFMVNLESYNAELTGLNKNLWAIFAYLSIFLIWNKYPKQSSSYLSFTLLKYFGAIGLIILAIVYRSGTMDNQGWMSTSWWGILGLIGWGYLVAALTYIKFKNRIFATLTIWIFFIAMNILSQNSLLSFLDPIKPLFGVILSGNVPSMVLSGLLIGIVLIKYKEEHQQFLFICISIGLVCIAIGFILRNWFIISKIMGTPSWAMLCIGISMVVFALLFYLLDIKKWSLWSKAFLPAGQNSLTTYLAPDLIYFTIWLSGSNILFYKQSGQPWLAIAGSLVWAFLMIGFAALLAKMKIRLKL